MIGSFNKVYNHPIIVDEGQLHNLSNTIIKRFDKVEYEIHTVDGASYKLPSIDDVITYSNPDSRRIIKINMTSLMGSGNSRNDNRVEILIKELK